MSGTMHVMGQSGDTKVVWDADHPDEVNQARRTFEELRAKGFNAYEVTRKGEKGNMVTNFNPDAEKIILAPPMQGG